MTLRYRTLEQAWDDRRAEQLQGQLDRLRDARAFLRRHGDALKAEAGLVDDIARNALIDVAGHLANAVGDLIHYEERLAEQIGRLSRDDGRP